MGQVNVDGRHGGNTTQEHPQRQHVARERSKEDKCVDGGEEEVSYGRGAEAEGGVLR